MNEVRLADWHSVHEVIELRGCQVVAGVALLDTLPCKARESGGRQCERLDEHGEDHAISEHTIRHSIAGNGYRCSAFE